MATLHIAVVASAVAEQQRDERQVERRTQRAVGLRGERRQPVRDGPVRRVHGPQRRDELDAAGRGERASLREERGRGLTPHEGRGRLGEEDGASPGVILGVGVVDEERQEAAAGQERGPVGTGELGDLGEIELHDERHRCLLHRGPRGRLRQVGRATHAARADGERGEVGALEDERRRGRDEFSQMRGEAGVGERARHHRLEVGVGGQARSNGRWCKRGSRKLRKRFRRGLRLLRRLHAEACGELLAELRVSLHPRALPRLRLERGDDRERRMRGLDVGALLEGLQDRRVGEARLGGERGETGEHLGGVVAREKHGVIVGTERLAHQLGEERLVGGKAGDERGAELGEGRAPEHAKRDAEPASIGPHVRRQRAMDGARGAREHRRVGVARVEEVRAPARVEPESGLRTEHAVRVRRVLGNCPGHGLEILARGIDDERGDELHPTGPAVGLGQGGAERGATLR